MKVTKILGLTLVIILLVVPACVNGKSQQECFSDYFSAVYAITEVTEVNEICGLTKTLFNCIASGQSLNALDRQELKTLIQYEFDKHNLKCNYSVDQIVDETFKDVDEDSSSKETKSLQECLNDYYIATVYIQEDSEVCGLIKNSIDCAARGNSLNSEEREAVKKFIQSKIKRFNINCDYSVKELVDEAFNGAKTSSNPLSFLTLILVAFGGFTLVRNLA